MRSLLAVFVIVSAFSGCQRDNPKHHVKEMLGTYTGTWTFTRNNGTTSELGIVEVNQGSTKKTVYVGPEMAEFEIDGNLNAVMIGNQYRLSFPEGNTDVIKFERLWEGGYEDEFVGYKQDGN